MQLSLRRCRKGLAVDQRKDPKQKIFPSREISFVQGSQTESRMQIGIEEQCYCQKRWVVGIKNK